MVSLATIFHRTFKPVTARTILRPALAIALLSALVGAPAAKACSTETHLSIVNMTDTPIVNTEISGIHNSDWDGHSRPDANFNGIRIAAGTMVQHREELNCGHPGAYTMKVTFQDGGVVSFFNDESDALKNYYRPFNGYTKPLNKYRIVQYTNDNHNYISIMLNIDPQRWMTNLPGSTPLTSLTIPGTHDSAAWKNSFSTYVRTQDTDIGQQLDDGIRFLDIRVRRVPGNRWVLVHSSVYLYQNFTGLLQTIHNFFSRNPKESIIMSIKEDEGPMPGVTETMSQIFHYYENSPSFPSVKWYTGTTLPILRDVRGKVVLLRRFGIDSGENPYGLDLSNWADNATFTRVIPTKQMTKSSGRPPAAQTIKIQDEYGAGGSDKENAAINLMNEARGDDSADHTYINFFSDNTGSCFNMPNNCSNVVMPVLRGNIVSSPSKTRIGIVPMDFYADSYPVIPALLATNPYP